ncbi:hypothetical protein CTAYLR_007129 [Chrysophaeum taylorii]|uniref:UDENN domain-containing protein n=1 Tax=Chrysophaeum taylorii TaxID=2483200 RepID=A0AAD7U9M5_9STRA|nr:hypothetical protein CTAYLR_007129 [Chrysophaeum taylorii]
MEAMAILGLHESFEVTEDQDWMGLVVDVGVVFPSEECPDGWEVCEGTLTPGLGIRPSRLAVLKRRAAYNPPPKSYVSRVVVAEAKPDGCDSWSRVEKSVGGRDANLTKGVALTWRWTYVWVRRTPDSPTRLAMPRGVVGLRWQTDRRGGRELRCTMSPPLGVAGVRRRVAVLDAWPPTAARAHGTYDPSTLAELGEDEGFVIPRALPLFVFDGDRASLRLYRRDSVPAPQFFCFSLAESTGERSFVTAFAFDERLDDDIGNRLRKRLAAERDARDWRKRWDGDGTDDDDDDMTQSDDHADDLNNDSSSSTSLHAPTVVCVFWRRRGSHAMTRAFATALYRLALSGQPKSALRVMAAAMKGLPLPPPYTRIEIRAVMTDEAGQTLPQLAPIIARASRLERAGLELVGSREAWQFIFDLDAEAIVRLLEYVLLERSVVACSRSAAKPSLFLDAIKALLFPLQYALPFVERLPASLARDLLTDSVVPMLAGCVVGDDSESDDDHKDDDSNYDDDNDLDDVVRTRRKMRDRVVPGGVGQSVCVVDLDDGEVDFGGDGDVQEPTAPAGPRAHLVQRIRALRRESRDEEDDDVANDDDEEEDLVEGVALRDAVLRFMATLLGDARGAVLEPKDGANFFADGFRACFDEAAFVDATLKRLPDGREFMVALTNTQQFAHLAQRFVEVDAGDRGLVFFEAYAAASVDLEAMLLADEGEKLEPATLRVPLLSSDASADARAATVPPGRYGVFAALFGDRDAVTRDVRAAEQTIRESLSELRTKVRRLSDADSHSVAYRRSLLVRGHSYRHIARPSPRGAKAATSSSSYSWRPATFFGFGNEDLVSTPDSLPDGAYGARAEESACSATCRALVEIYSAYFVCVPRLVRRRAFGADVDDDELVLVLVRALGLLFHANASVTPSAPLDEVVFRALLLGTAQLRALAAGRDIRAFAMVVAKCLFKSMRDAGISPQATTFAIYAAAVALDTDFRRGLDATVFRSEHSGRLLSGNFGARPRLEEDEFERFAAIASSGVSWLEHAGRAFCQENKVDYPLLDRDDSKCPSWSDDHVGSLPLVGMSPEAICSVCGTSLGDDHEILAALVANDRLVCTCGRECTPHLAVFRARLTSRDDETCLRVDYHSPKALRRAVEKRISSHGEKALEMDVVLRDSPTLFYNCLWYYSRLLAPVPMRGGDIVRGVIAVVLGPSSEHVKERCSWLLKQNIQRKDDHITTDHHLGSTDDAAAPSKRNGPVAVAADVFGSISPKRTYFVFC